MPDSSTKKTYYIETERLGKLNIEHFKNGVAKYGSMAAWADHLGVGASTVKGWKAKFIEQGASL